TRCARDGSDPPGPTRECPKESDWLNGHSRQPLPRRDVPVTITSAFRHPRPIAARLVRTLFLVTLAAIVLLPRAAVAVPDTTYLNNAYTGSTVDGTITYPFKSILAALAARTGGPDRVFAVMGSNTPYRESITIADPDSGLAGH